MQLALIPGETLETGTGRKITLGAEPLELTPDDLGGSIRHHGWTMSLDPAARLTWPFYPHNPYSDSPETDLKYAVGRLTIPLFLKSQPGHYIRPNEKQVVIKIRTTP